MAAFYAISARHNDHSAQSGTPGGKSNTLTVITARCRDHTSYVRLSLLQLVHVHQPAADLERANGLVVLVLNPNLGAGPLAEQRPTDLRRPLQNGVNEVCRGTELFQGRGYHKT